MLDRGQILTHEQRQTLLASQQAAITAQQQQAYALAGYTGQGSGLPGAGGLGGLSPTMGGVGMGPGGVGALPGQQGGAPLSDLEARQRAELERVYIVKQQRWLLFLRHASKCNAPDGQCPYTPHCHVARRLWAHVLSCQNSACTYPRCVASRELLKHHQRCQEQSCPVCAPVRHTMMKQRAMQHQMHSEQQQQQPQAQPGAAGGMSHRNGARVPYGAMHAGHHYAGGAYAGQGGYSGAAAAAPAGKGQAAKRARADAAALTKQQQQQQMLLMQQQARQPVVPANALVEKGQSRARPKDAGPEGTSLCECFSEEELRVHLNSLRVADLKPPSSAVPMSARRREAESAGAAVQPASANAQPCTACGNAGLYFDPPTMYCTNCNIRIKPKQTYYLVQAGESKQCFCTSCHSGFGSSVEVDGNRFLKTHMMKRKNEEDLEEPWVACDLCSAWVHQICTLFNGRRDISGDNPFTCPNCMLDQLRKAERKPTVDRPSSQQPASALPKTQLSDFLEEYLARHLATERAERARMLGKQPDEVPGAEGLCVRVVSCITKQLDTKSEFLRAFAPARAYPSSFLYRSKVVIIFQRIEGVDVCLFCMYVQEYGADQPAPNARRIYLSYLDSVKYFRPDIMTMRGNEALRTYVYHTLLCGYLDAAKRRGFTSCYIWACPPLPGDDYIFYCHPAKQKTPKSDKLREWYLKMLASARAEGVVVSLGNLYDELRLDPSGDTSRGMRSAVDVPYFDGDYWPGAVEEYIGAFKEEAKRRADPAVAAAAAAAAAAAGSKRDRSGKAKGRAGEAKPAEGSVEALDAFVMGKLAENIKSMKNDFIMVHLWHECCRCRRTISDEPRFRSSPDEPHFELCEECFNVEDALPQEERLWRGGTLRREQVAALPDTKDADPDMECEFFDTRQAFLSMCQGNKYQFDTLRRAKHSSMMVLFHLHNPTEPAYVATCNLCSQEMDPGTGWRCETCPDFDVCDTCRNTRGHAHPLRPQGNRRDTTRVMSKEERQARMKQLQRTMELLVHASGCQSDRCTSSNCANVKNLFSHAYTCPVRAAGGCNLCRKLWTLLQVHAKQCFQANCPVPRCKDLKEYRRRAAEQIEERRRQAFAHYRSIQNQQG